MPTWGELGLRLQKAFPGLDPDVRIGHLNGAYERILSDLPWRRLQGENVVQTVAPYETGTVAVTNGSTTVTGSGTTFTSAMTGRKFRVPGRNEFYSVTYVSATELTLDRPYEGSTDAAAAYKVYSSRYNLPAGVRWIEEIRNPTLDRPMERMTLRELNEAFPTRETFGDPQYWAPAEDVPESAVNVYSRIEVYPNPDESYGLPYTYQKAAVGFDGSNTSGSPLPWVSGEALLARAKYLCAVDLADPRAEAFEEQFNEAMDKMRATEYRARNPFEMKMDSRHTRHRRARGLDYRGASIVLPLLCLLLPFFAKGQATLPPTSPPATSVFLLDGAVDGDCIRYDAAQFAWVRTASASCGGGAAITSLNGETGATQTFADVDDTNVTLTVSSAANTHTFTLGWTGTLAESRIASTITRDTEWDSVAEIETATSANIITDAEIDSEAELEALLVGVTNVFTNNDGALADDDLSDDAITALSDVAAKSGTGTTVLMQGSPTITTPTIASFANAAHDHEDAAGGGTLGDAAVADTITASNYLPLAGGTVTGAVNVDEANFNLRDAEDDTQLQLIAGALNLFDSNGATQLLRIDAGGLSYGNGLTLDFSSTSAWNGSVAVRLVNNSGALNMSVGSGYQVGGVDVLTVAGGTLTGALVADAQGVEFEESDDAVTCAAGDYWIRADLSETTLKKCLNGTETVLDTTGGSPAFSDITGATNTSAAMVIGTGASLTVSGSGTINATSLSSTALADFILETELDTIAELQTQIADATLLTTADEGSGNGIDADTVDGLEAAALLPLSGGTMTGQLVADNLGIEFGESDTNPTCSAGNFTIYADLSENKLKKCQNGTATDLDTSGAGSAINVEENNSEVVSSASLTGIDFLGADFDVTDDANEADVAIAATITRDTEWDTAAEINAATSDDDFVTLAGTQTISGDKTFSGTNTFGSASANFLVAEGATADAFETTFAVTDPTADRTITFPDATGTVPLLDNTATLTNKTINTASNTITVAAADISDQNAGTDITADLEEESHASEHQNGGGDEVATATPGANAIPKAEADGDLANGWIGQDQGYTWTGTHDFGGGTLEVPNSTTLPGTCTVGQSYMDTDATSGSRWYLCESTNTWVAQGGGGGSTCGWAVIPLSLPGEDNGSANPGANVTNTNNPGEGRDTNGTVNTGAYLFLNAGGTVYFKFEVPHNWSNSCGEIGVQFTGRSAGANGAQVATFDVQIGSGDENTDHAMSPDAPTGGATALSDNTNINSMNWSGALDDETINAGFAAVMSVSRDAADTDVNTVYILSGAVFIPIDNAVNPY